MHNIEWNVVIDTHTNQYVWMDQLFDTDSENVKTMEWCQIGRHMKYLDQMLFGKHFLKVRRNDAIQYKQSINSSAVHLARHPSMQRKISLTSATELERITSTAIRHHGLGIYETTQTNTNNIFVKITTIISSIPVAMCQAMLSQQRMFTTRYTCMPIDRQIRKQQHAKMLKRQLWPLGSPESSGLEGRGLISHFYSPQPDASLQCEFRSDSRERVSCCRSTELLLIFAYTQRDG